MESLLQMFLNAPIGLKNWQIQRLISKFIHTNKFMESQRKKVKVYLGFPIFFKRNEKKFEK